MFVWKHSSVPFFSVFSFSFSFWICLNLAGNITNSLDYSVKVPATSSCFSEFILVIVEQMLPNFFISNF